MNWSAEAEKSLKEVPFVRPAVRRRIESMGRNVSLSALMLLFMLSRTICPTLSEDRPDRLPTFDLTGAAQRADDDHLYLC